MTAIRRESTVLRRYHLDTVPGVIGAYGSLLLCLTLAACSSTDEETAIQRLIDAGVTLAEAHDPGGMMDLTSDDFIAEPGAYPRTEAKRFLFVGLKRYGNFRIHHPRPSITVAADKQQATATLHFLIVNKEQRFPELQVLYDNPIEWLAAIDDSADLFTLVMQLRRDDEEWRVLRAKLTRFAGLGSQGQ